MSARCDDSSQSFSIKINHYLAKAAEVGRIVGTVGPFIASVDPADDNPYRNYAIPIAGASPDAADVARLIEWFVDRKRKPRLEYIPEGAPSVETALLAAGFGPEGLLPLMTLRGNGHGQLALPEGIEFLSPATDADFNQVAQAQNQAYSGGDPNEADIARLKRNAELGGEILAARDIASGRIAGAGLYTPPHEGVTEIAAIGVISIFRRRGIAAALTAKLAEIAISRTIALPFLMAEGPTEQRIYERAGFELRKRILHISLPVYSG